MLSLAMPTRPAESQVSNIPSPFDDFTLSRSLAGESHKKMGCCTLSLVARSSFSTLPSDCTYHNGMWCDSSSVSKNVSQDMSKKNCRKDHFSFIKSYLRKKPAPTSICSKVSKVIPSAAARANAKQKEDDQPLIKRVFRIQNQPICVHAVSSSSRLPQQ